MQFIGIMDIIFVCLFECFADYHRTLIQNMKKTSCFAANMKEIVL